MTGKEKIDFDVEKSFRYVVDDDASGYVLRMRFGDGEISFWTPEVEGQFAVNITYPDKGIRRVTEMALARKGYEPVP
ncbi:hypothetical protein CMO89_04640 [Candidatus Woesearchaeota archaeon]|nr:hypothetical protein [Candidatus Woesearchaeota archaeon]|tara:strand:+ start:5819 stop:6049 length:231 start_codon:yes stop_codon:yes gene_type:complete